MNDQQRIKTSKFLSLVLRHEPQKIGLTLDASGWADVEDLIAACGKHRLTVKRSDLEKIVAHCEKQRFAFSDDGQKIRASQGHSIKVSLGYTARTPPPHLFHGTATRFLPFIQEKGLVKGGRHHVHLSEDVETAHRVGRRHGKAAVLIVNAQAMAARGHEFFLSDNGVWLTEHVPVEFLEFSSGPTEKSRQPAGTRSSRAHLAKETVAICAAGHYLATNGSEVQIGPAIQAAVAGTRCYVLDPARPLTTRGPVVPTQLVVTDETTIAALQRLSAEPGGNLACLNFASAKNPGGGFLGGSEAQEESLARSSALYPCLLAAPAYYENNRACRTALYLDQVIWSPAVPFFRNDSGTLLGEPILASVITAPAPNAGAIAMNEPANLPEVEPTLRRRAEFVLAIAAEYQVRRLVLGAWGCGVFRNDPRLVARVFADRLDVTGPFTGIFDEVVFAIYDRSSDQAVVQAFQEALA